MAKNWISKLFPNIPMKTLRIKIKNSISNLIKFLIKIYFAKNLTSKLSPNILMKTLNKKKYNS